MQIARSASQQPAIVVAAHRNDTVSLEQFAALIDRTGSICDVTCREHEFDAAFLEPRERRSKAHVLRMNVANHTDSSHRHARAHLLTSRISTQELRHLSLS